MSKAPSYQWYPKDFQSDEKVRLMDYEQQGVYRALLDHQWLHGSIPPDPEDIAALLRVPLAQFQGIWRRVSPCFTLKLGRLVNPRLSRNRAEYDAFCVKQGRNGRKGGRPKKEPVENPPETQTKPKPIPTTNPNESSPVSGLRSAVSGLLNSVTCDSKKKDNTSVRRNLPDPEVPGESKTAAGANGVLSLSRPGKGSDGPDPDPDPAALLNGVARKMRSPRKPKPKPIARLDEDALRALAVAGDDQALREMQRRKAADSEVAS